MKMAYLKDVCDVTMGQAPPGSSYNTRNDGLPLVAGAGDLGALNPIPKNYTTAPTRISSIGDIILCIRATIGDVNWSDRTYCLGRGVAGLTPHKDVLHPQYVWYWLKTSQKVLAREARGSTFKQVSRDAVESMRIPLPPLPEQRRIAAILDKADAIRQKRQEAVRCLTNLKPCIFLDMFGNLVRNSKHWPTTRLGEVCDSRLGKMLDAKQQTGKHQRPYLRNANVQWNRLDLSEVLEMDFDKKDCEIFRLRYGDVLICEGGEVGRAALWHDQLPECYFQKALHRVRPDPTKMTSEYIVNLMWFYAHNGGFKKHVTSATIAHLTGVKLKEIVIPIPPLSLQKEFVERVREIMKLESEQVESIHHQDDLFNSLVQRAFRGELVTARAEVGQPKGSSYEAASVLLAKIKAQRKNIKPQRKPGGLKTLRN